MFRKTITIGLDYKNFVGGTTEINRKLRLLDDEFRLATEQAKSFGDESTQLELKQETLRQKFILQEKAVKQAEKAYDEILQIQDASAKKIDYADSQLLKARTALEKTRNELKEIDEKMSASSHRTEELGSSMEILNKRLQLATERNRLNGESVEALEEQYELLSQKVEQNYELVEIAREKYEKATKAEDTNREALKRLETQLLDAQIAYEQSSNKLTEMSGKMSAGTEKGKTFGDTIRKIASAAGLETSPAVEALAEKFDNVSAGAGAAILAVGTLLTTLAKFSIEAAAQADDLLTLSTVTGISTDQLQKMSYASNLLDVSVETVQDSMKGMIGTMRSARDGTQETAEAYKRLNVRITDGTGQLRNSEDVFYDVVDALGRVRSETERDSLAMVLFGESAQNLNPLIEAGSGALKAYGDEAERIGAVMSEDELNKLGRLQNSLDRMDQAGKGLKMNLGLVLAPALTMVFETLNKLSVKQLEGIVKMIAAVTTAIAAFKIIMTIVETVDKFKVFFSVTEKGFGSIFIKIMAVVIAITALVAIIAILVGKTNDIERVGASIGKTAGEINDSVSSATAIMNKGPSYHASGTPDFRGGRAWVGEAGPELVELPAGSRIYSNRESRRMSGGDTYYFNLQTDSIKEYTNLVTIAQNRRRIERMG